MDIFQPLQVIANFIVFQIFQLDESSYLGSALVFFIYDTVKIGILLLIINYLMAISRYYFPINKARDILTKNRWFGLEYLMAALLGVVTPFCSCSSIPLFIGFLSAGIPLGVTFTFLISSPLVNESSLVLFPAIFGLKTTIFYNLIGMIIAIFGGMLIGKLKMEKYLAGDLVDYQWKNKKLPWVKLPKFWWQQTIGVSKKIFPYVILGVGVGAVIHGFVPTGVIEKYLAIRQWWVVPLAVILGVPLYANSVSIIPVIQALIEKGVPLGTALAFMTATVTLSIPEALMLKRVMKWPLLLTFFGVTIIGIMMIGWLFNLYS